MRAWAILLLLPMLIAFNSACDRDDEGDDVAFTAECVSGYSREAGHGIEYLIPEDGVDSGWGKIRTPDEIEKDCAADGGAFCDPDDWISTRAAICIAKNDGEVEDTQWVAFVIYSPTTGYPAWIVETTNEASFWEIHVWSGALLSDGYTIIDTF